MQAKGTPVGDDERKALAGERGKDGEDAEIPNMRRIHAGWTGSSLREEESRKNAESADGSIGRDENGADVKEYGMHVRRIRYRESASQQVSVRFAHFASLGCCLPRSLRRGGLGTWAP